MFRLVGTSVVLGVALAVLGTAAYAAAVPPDASEYQWAQGQPAGVASLPDANERAVQILVNNSGGPPGGPANSATPDSFLAAFNQHLVAAQVLLQALLPGMKASGYGRDMSKYVLEEYTNTKHVMIRHDV